MSLIINLDIQSTLDFACYFEAAVADFLAWCLWTA